MSTGVAFVHTIPSTDGWGQSNWTVPLTEVLYRCGHALSFDQGARYPTSCPTCATETRP